LSSRDRAIADAFHFLRLDSVKYRILLFAVVATLLPALTTTWLFYAHNKRALAEKTTAELLNASAIVARESNLWLKERFYDVRVFSSSYEVSENLERIARTYSGTGTTARRRLESYLESVRGRFAHYEELTVFDLDSNVVASSGAGTKLVIKRSWMSRLKKEGRVIGEVQLDEKLEKEVLPIVVAIKSSAGKLQGGLTAKLNLSALNTAVQEATFAETGQIHVLKQDGSVVTGAGAARGDLFESWLNSDTVDSLLDSRLSAIEYTNQRGNRVMGTVELIPGLDWMVLTEIAVADAFSQITELREQTVIFLCMLLVGIGFIAYVLGVSIARPLNRLTEGAARVAEGDLAVTISTDSRGELGYLTRVFNDMVGRLRVGREELERLSITDSLTGLYNRMYLTENLAEHVAGTRESQCVFSILMIDVDHFKAYNDTYGHLAGDEVLVRLGAIMRSQVPSPGFVARYGGEEFFALLPDSDEKCAVKIAEEIRLATENEPFCDVPARARPTVSIGVAAFQGRDLTPEAIIAAADRALYQAKKKGRNRVARARRKPDAAA
jgi:diguanylate cyclase (GGDEF)-like protein